MKPLHGVRTAVVVLLSASLGLAASSCADRDRGDAGPSAPEAAPAVWDNSPIYGNSMPGDWRPFHPLTVWNTKVPPGSVTHPLNDTIMGTMTRTENIRFGNRYLPPFWVVERYDNMQKHPFRSAKIFDPWDCCPKDSVADILLPIVGAMYEEPTLDSHIIIYDREYERIFECSYFDWLEGEEPIGTTFNIWAAYGPGFGLPWGWDRWQLQGGRGTGVPVIAGLIRPEEIAYGEIRHALAFTFGDLRMGENGENMFLVPPACRSDGLSIGEEYPIAGMRFQLDPALGDADWDALGLGADARVVARAAQQYGAYLVDKGGDWAFQLQLMGPTPEMSRAFYDDAFPGLYHDLKQIPTSAFHIVYTVEPTIY